MTRHDRERGEPAGQGRGAAMPLPRWLPFTALVLSVAGLGVSAYLTAEHYAGNGSLSCPSTSGFDCIKVTTSPESYVFGVPVALLGLLFFAAMVVINIPELLRTSLRWIGWLRLAMVVVGIGFVIYLIYSELFSIKAICVWCTAVHVITFLLFVVVLWSAATLAPSAGATDVTS